MKFKKSVCTNFFFITPIICNRFLWKFFSIFFVLLLLNSGTYGQTLVKDDTVSSNWTLNGSPYIINTNLYVASNAVLTIEPGVEVWFTGPYSLFIKGTIKAEGTAKMPISFTVADSVIMEKYSIETDSNYNYPSKSWKGVRFLNETNQFDTSRLYYCIFTDANSTWGESPTSCGGALSINGKRNLLIQNCSFIGNRAIVGGAIYCQGSEVTLTNCVFKNNHSHSDGGTLYLTHSKLSIISCKIIDNQSNEFGGGIFFNESDVELINNLISNNVARFGGALALKKSKVYITNNTIVENFAFDNGGGIHCDNSSPEIVNTVFWGNKSKLDEDQVFLYKYSTPSISSTCLQNGLAGIRKAKEMPENNLESIDVMNYDPHFNEDDKPYTFAENSPYIDAGTINLRRLPLDKDISGYPRINGGYIDLGAFESNFELKESSEKLVEGFINNDDDKIDLSASPNPSCGRFKLLISNSKGFKGYIKIYDINAKIVYDSDLRLQDNLYSTDIELCSPRGIYILELIDVSGRTIDKEKLVIE